MQILTAPVRDRRATLHGRRARAVYKFLTREAAVEIRGIVATHLQRKKTTTIVSTLTIIPAT